MRKQYHLQLQPNCRFNVWDIDKLIKHSKDFPVFEIEISQIKELDEPFWYQDEDSTPTCRSIAEHAQLIQDANLDYPIILSAENGVMDGMHRISKALLNNIQKVKAVRFNQTPEPDFLDVHPDELTY